MNQFIDDWNKLSDELSSSVGKWKLPELSPMAVGFESQQLDVQALKQALADIDLNQAGLQGWLLASDQLYVLPCVVPEEANILQAEFCCKNTESAWNEHWQITHQGQGLWLFIKFRSQKLKDTDPLTKPQDKNTHHYMAEQISYLAEQVAHLKAKGFELPERLNYLKFWRINNTGTMDGSWPDYNPDSLPVMPGVELALFNGFDYVNKEKK